MTVRRAGEPDGTAMELKAGLSRSGVGAEPGAGAKVSIVVVLQQNLARAEEIYQEYAPPLRELGRGFEFLFIAGSRQTGLARTIGPAEGEEGTFRVLEVSQPVGESALLKMAAEHCRGDVVVTFPASFRVAPEALPELIQQLDRGSDLAVARRWPRRDAWLNRVQSKACNWTLNTLTGSHFHDITCRISAMRREVLSEIPLYGSYFRFLPIVAEREGFRVDEVTVRPHRRGDSTRVFGIGAYLGWVIDILGIFFMLRFTYRPLRFFGLVGASFSLAGAIILAVLLIQRLGGQGIANRPLLLLGVLLVTLGVQSVGVGLIGEIVVHFQAATGSTYRLARTGRAPDS
jgi:hypothetical protein